MGKLMGSINLFASEGKILGRKGVAVGGSILKIYFTYTFQDTGKLPKLMHEERSPIAALSAA